MMVSKRITYFQRMLKHTHPTLWDRVNVSVSSQSNYQQQLGLDGRMRAELNYNSVKYEIIITFPNIGDLYYDISTYIRFVWGCDVVRATFDFDGTNHFIFEV
jgi:hypothetical protein